MQSPIMIVDDSEDTRELFKAALESEGFSVVGAKSGPEALDLLQQSNNYSLILLDISMPGMDGVKVLEEMQRLRLGQGVPVMLVSAMDNLANMKVTENVIDTLKKPFFYPELIFKIKQKLGIRPDGKRDRPPLSL